MKSRVSKVKETKFINKKIELSRYRKEKWIKRICYLSEYPGKFENIDISKIENAIYAIFNNKTTKIYIGQTKKTLEYRWVKLRQTLKAGSIIHQYNYMRQRGLHNFTIIPLSLVQKHPDPVFNRMRLAIQERTWMHKFATQLLNDPQT